MQLDGDDDEDNEIIGAENIFGGEAIAGGAGIQGNPYSLQFDAERSACMGALDPVVRRLVQEGRSANAIISALAAVTVLTLERQKQH